ncbi:TlyA family RNA methyltransferase [Cryobacterium psychrophilum]|uniref:TlyA family RNA methyltransferase n=1 Tax=Cryobacterium psychrophilum TaxID=41988 RepID=A0A4Y8KWW9_9MICO|nr:TlyA family RNA methyltransferase [Cryobacterium psychrophilum]TDW28972.1 23S rRNA (cytidine1920-2'-O)/16S rRNA (cytidine1409-2'-O)-methyltransferase [Cryobacterium psychrophilum]TFD81249.1 TlyA family RNA methyltransferase [Cryobacterium psychrophilum]
MSDTGTSGYRSNEEREAALSEPVRPDGAGFNEQDLTEEELAEAALHAIAPPEVLRLDAALTERGLVRSRTVAAKLITGGLVTVDGVPVVKSSHRVKEDAVLEVAATDHYVSRGAHKLVAALDAFDIPVTGRTVLDAGASTGGFSQVVLERGAAQVIAVDVGHGQLAPQLALEPKLTLVEGFNLRYSTAEKLAGASGITTRADLVVADLSFISLTTVLPALLATAADRADFVLLIKPQFEVGRGGIREGVVHDAGLRSDAVASVLWAGWDIGLRTNGLIASPIAGAAGNREYLCHMSTTVGSSPTEWIDRIDALVGV